MKHKLPLPVKCNRHLIYSLPADWIQRTLNSTEVELTWADYSTVDRLFRRERKLRARFHGFLRRRCIGLFQCISGGWVTYAWTSMPGRRGPDHMPVTSREKAYWIFHCGTRESFRGRGLYQQSLQVLAERARQECAGTDVFIDTQTNNLPSRRAILSVGFQPLGMAKSWTLSMPRVIAWTYASWQKDQPHPLVPRNAA
jgi:GNAT superfamily N-acetyltransferase